MSKHKPNAMQLAAAKSSGAGAKPSGAGGAGARRQGSASGGQRPRSRSRWLRGGLIAVAVAAAVAIAAVVTSNSTSTPALTGKAAPPGSFTTTSGRTETVAALKGEPTLLWFVTTWCSSCQAGTATMAQQIQTFAARHVRVVELELAGDLGQPGPAISEFASQLAGSEASNPDWTFGVASPSLTRQYDPSGYLDIYYLLDASGRVRYINGSPSATMGQLLAHIDQLG